MAKLLGKDDLLFYESAVVLKVAQAMPGKPYDDLSSSARNRRLNAAAHIAQQLFADNSVCQRFKQIAN